MIQELLLSLSGHPSPLLSLSKHDNDGHGLQSLLSPAELALLSSLADGLGGKHRDIRRNATIISSSHPSTVCRAVSTAIISTHLAGFQQRILEVERDILEQNPSIVGAYNIVPLSAVVGAFDGWERKLEWLWSLVQFIQATSQTASERLDGGQESCTAAGVIERLRDSTHTGYPDIEKMSLDLVRVAETAWLKQISTWVLHGRDPEAVDFFITREVEDHRERNSVSAYIIKDSLVPCFVDPPAAKSILFIGKSLSHIRDRQTTLPGHHFKIHSPDTFLLPNHLAHLSALKSPISSSSFSTAINSIRLSLSQNALQRLLPMTKVLGILHVLKDFFLLERGEFAIGLITAADDRLTSRHQRGLEAHGIAQRGVNGLASMTIKEGEVHAVLARTWTALASLQNFDDEEVDEELELARDLIRLSIKTVDMEPAHSRNLASLPRASTTTFDDLLLPSATALSLRVPSPLDLFLAPSDVDTYSRIHAYLLAIRRAHLRLSRLFLLSVLRRDHPSPRAPAHLDHEDAMEVLARNRKRASQRIKSMRPIWATIGSATFFLAEVGEYFQGEVIRSSWATFHAWLVPSIEHDPKSNETDLLSSLHLDGSHIGSRPVSSRASDDVASYGIHDPESLTQAHRSYLASLESLLLLNDATFINLLRRLMTAIDHISALMQRLNAVQQNHDREIQADVMGVESSYAAEERGLLSDLQNSRSSLATGVEGLIEALRRIDSARAGGRSVIAEKGMTEAVGFAPWTSNGVDRLLLKFDYGNAEKLTALQLGEG